MHYKVSIVITSYNLENYISQALDSILNQVTDYAFNIIVADDCSTDETVSILREYKQKYPEKIVLLETDHNIGSLSNSNRAFETMDCDYFSFLDGDDYWVGADRINKQIDFLEKNKEFVMHAGNTRYLRDEKPAELLIEKKYLNTAYGFEDYLNQKMPFVHTSSIMLRNCLFSEGLPDCYHSVVGTFEECALRGEDFRRILHLTRGKMYIDEDIMSVYRIHSAGIWQSSSKTHKVLESAIALNYYKKYFGMQYGSYFETKSKEAYKGLIKYLLVHEDFLNTLKMDEKDLRLFIEYLNDVCIRTDHRFKRKTSMLLKRVALKLFEIV